MGRIREQDTAFGHRDATYHCDIFSLWTDPLESERHIRWVRDFWTAMQPYAAGVYVNSLGNEGEDRVRAAYPRATYARLVALKNKYDPTNLFRLNQNIKPTVSQQQVKHQVDKVKHPTATAEGLRSSRQGLGGEHG